MQKKADGKLMLGRAVLNRLGIFVAKEVSVDSLKSVITRFAPTLMHEVQDEGARVALKQLADAAARNSTGLFGRVLGEISKENLDNLGVELFVEATKRNAAKQTAMASKETLAHLMGMYPHVMQTVQKYALANVSMRNSLVYLVKNIPTPTNLANVFFDSGSTTWKILNMPAAKGIGMLVAGGGILHLVDSLAEWKHGVSDDNASLDSVVNNLVSILSNYLDSDEPALVSVANTLTRILEKAQYHLKLAMAETANKTPEALVNNIRVFTSNELLALAYIEHVCNYILTNATFSEVANEESGSAATVDQFTHVINVSLIGNLKESAKNGIDLVKSTRRTMELSRNNFDTKLSESLKNSAVNLESQVQDTETKIQQSTNIATPTSTPATTKPATPAAKPKPTNELELDFGEATGSKAFALFRQAAQMIK